MTNKEAIEILNNRLNTYYCTDEDLQAIDLAIKALEERPQGEWIVKTISTFPQVEPNEYFCPFCHIIVNQKRNYCHHCGADLRYKLC